MTYAEIAETPALAALRADAVALMPARHQNVAWETVTAELAVEGRAASDLTAKEIAKLCTEMLDESAREHADEQAYQASLR